MTANRCDQQERCAGDERCPLYLDGNDLCVRQVEQARILAEVARLSPDFTHAVRNLAQQFVLRVEEGAKNYQQSVDAAIKRLIEEETGR